MEKPHKLIYFSHTVYGLESQACNIPKRESNHLIKQEPLKHYVLRQINFLIKTPKVHVNMIIFKNKANLFVHSIYFMFKKPKNYFISHFYSKFHNSF